MAQHNELGKEGEARASLYLLLNGYHILARNLRDPHCEIDIIADDYGEVAFIEVKTRMLHADVRPVFPAADGIRDSSSEEQGNCGGQH